MTSTKEYTVEYDARKTRYLELLLRVEWRNKRVEILDRDLHRCRNCGSRNLLQVHHRQYHIIEQKGEYKAPWEYESHNLITLCSSCHREGHKRYKVPVFNV